MIDLGSIAGLPCQRMIANDYLNMSCSSRANSRSLGRSAPFQALRGTRAFSVLDECPTHRDSYHAAWPG